MTTDSAYSPPDPTQVEDKPEAFTFWAQALETDEDTIRRAVRKVGPELQTVKKELGIDSVG